MIIVFGVVIDVSLRSLLVEELFDDLTRQAVNLAMVVDGSTLDAEAVTRHARALKARVTLIDANGVVIADSASDPDEMEDHSLRPEVEAALSGRVGSDRRVSATTGERRLYVAAPTDRGVILRLSVTEDRVARLVSQVRTRLAWAALLTGLMAASAMALAGRRAARPVIELSAIAETVAAGDVHPQIRRSPIRELDRLGVSIGRIAENLGDRVRQADDERAALVGVLEALPHGVALVSADDSVPYVSPQYLALFGRDGPSLSRLTPVALQGLVRTARQTKLPISEIIEHGTPTRLIRVMAVQLEDGNRVLVLASDVTEANRIEAMRRDFVADASHELKTPVAVIVAAAETLQLALDNRPEEARRFAVQVESAAKRLGRIVSDLLDLSRIEGGGTTVESVAFDAVVREEVERISGRAATAGVSVSVQYESITVMGNAGDLALAVRNLCENAVRFTDPGGWVTVRLAATPAGALLTVTDSGAGIPSRDIPRIFERFYRVDEARSRATGGTGLGLAIVKHVVERHGGTVGVTSELGAGSVFTIALPAADSQVPGAGVPG